MTETPQPVLDFDPGYYYDLVAQNLLRNLGNRALVYADEALRKMHAIGDVDGFDTWLNIHEHLTAHATAALRDHGATMH